MSTQREQQKARMAAAASRRAAPDAGPAGRTAIRSKPVRITLDLSPELYRQLTAWADSAAVTLDVPRERAAEACAPPLPSWTHTLPRAANARLMRSVAVSKASRVLICQV